MRLKIRSKDECGFTTRVWLDDQEITECVSLEVYFTTGERPIATIQFGFHELDIDAETTLVLQAVMDRQKQKNLEDKDESL